MRLRLRQTFGAHTGRHYEFAQSVVRVGRLPDSDVAFDPHADLDASGRHAEIRREAEGWVLVDVGSRNGTFVNGQRVQRHVLREGDELEFGPGGPRLRVEGEPHVPAGPFDGTLAATPVGPAARVPSASPPSPVRPDAATEAPTPTPRDAVSSPLGRPASGGPEARRYGERTVALMIREALIRDRTRRVVIAAGALVVAAAAFVVFAWAWDRLAAKEPGPDAASTAAANAGALLRVVVLRPGDAERTLCTAFAVRRQLLATTARCVSSIDRHRAAGARVELRGAAGASVVDRLWRHPAFAAEAAGPDVGLIEVTAPAPTLVSLAPASRLREVRAGDVLLAYGFVGDGARAVPVPVEGRAGGDGQTLLRHGAEAPVGAPVFDEGGVVVGIHAGAVLPGGAAAPGFVVGSDAILALIAGLGR